MSTIPPVPAIGVLLVVAAMATMPALLRWALRWATSGQITVGHVLLAQATLLVLADLSVRCVVCAAGRSLAPWRHWTSDAASVGGAMLLVLAGHVVSKQLNLAAVCLEAITLVVTAPIVEEIVYRGFLPVLLARAVRPADAGTKRVGIAIVSSAAFGAAHTGADGLAEAALHRFAVSFFCGLAFHVLRDTSGGLAAPIAAHAGVNAMSLQAM